MTEPKNNSAAPALTGETPIPFLDTGTGSAVVLLQSAQKSPLVELLAQHFRVIAFRIDAGRDPRNIAKTVSQTTDRLGITNYSVIGDSDVAPQTLALALDCSDRVGALVLISPTRSLARSAAGLPDGAAELRLEDIKAPTLALFGTNEGAAAFEAGQICARRIPNCFYTLVYDATHDIVAARPQALLAVVRDFVERKDEFVVGRESSAINLGGGA